MQSLLLSNAYEMGNTVGHTAAWVLGILFLVVWIWVMFKYLDTSDLN